MKLRPEQFWASVDQSGGPDACWPWIGKRLPTGYGRYAEQGRTMFAHRTALELATGIPLGSLQALHRCDNPPCVNPAHLFAGTQADNVRDMWRKGRAPSFDGEANPRAKLTTAQVRAIRESDERGIDLARRFGITKQQVSNIRLRKQWGAA